MGHSNRQLGPDIRVPGPHTNVLPGDSPATIQSKLDSLQTGGTLRFAGGITFDFHGTNITGKSSVTILAGGAVNIVNALRSRHRCGFRLLGQIRLDDPRTSPGEEPTNADRSLGRKIVIAATCSWGPDWLQSRPALRQRRGTFSGPTVEP